MNDIGLFWVALTAINIRMMVTKICDTIIILKNNKKELTAQSNKRNG